MIKLLLKVRFKINNIKNKTASIVSAPWWSYLLWFISASPPLFLPGPQLWRRSGERERWLLRSRQERCGTSDTLSLASSSASPPPPPPLSGPGVTVAPIRLPSTGLQMHSRPWLPSRLELDGQTLAVSSVEEHETETSLKLSPPVTGSSFCKKRAIGKHWFAFLNIRTGQHHQHNSMQINFTMAI